MLSLWQRAVCKIHVSPYIPSMWTTIIITIHLVYNGYTGLEITRLSLFTQVVCDSNDFVSKYNENKHKILCV